MAQSCDGRSMLSRSKSSKYEEVKTVELEDNTADEAEGALAESADVQDVLEKCGGWGPFQKRMLFFQV